MKRLSIHLCIAFVLMASLVLLTSCVTMPEAVPGLYINRYPDFTIKEISIIMNMSWSSIKSIVSNKNWSHVMDKKCV